MSKENKREIPEILQAEEWTFWLRADSYPDCDQMDRKSINDMVDAISGDSEEAQFKVKKCYMRPYTEEENEEIGEQDWWVEDNGTHPEAVEYYEFYPDFMEEE